MTPWLSDDQIPAEVFIAAALAELQGGQENGSVPAAAKNDPYSPWTRLKGFRMGMGK